MLPLTLGLTLPLMLGLEGLRNVWNAFVQGISSSKMLGLHPNAFFSLFSKFCKTGSL